MKEKYKRNYTLKVFENGKQVDRCQTHSLRRFMSHLRMINWKNSHPRVYLRVSYGKRLDNFGKITEFHNDGDYENENDLWLAFNAFIED